MFPYQALLNINLTSQGIGHIYLIYLWLIFVQYLFINMYSNIYVFSDKPTLEEGWSLTTSP